MAQIALLNALRQPIFLLAGIIGFAFAIVVYIYTQLIASFFSLEQWKLVLLNQNSAIPIIFSLLFGITLAYQAYLLQQKKCSIEKSAAGATSSSATIFGLLLVSQCPECATLGFFLLPASLVGYFSRFGWAIDALAIALLLYTLLYLGAFKIIKNEKKQSNKIKK